MNKYVKMGTGFACAGHNSAKLLFSAIAKEEVIEADENLGPVLPSGSAKIFWKILILSIHLYGIV